MIEVPVGKMKMRTRTVDAIAREQVAAVQEMTGKRWIIDQTNSMKKK